MPILKSEADKESLINDRDVLYKMIFSLKQEVDSLKSEMRSLSGGYNSAAIAGATGVQDETGGYVHADDNVIVSTTPVS